MANCIYCGSTNFFYTRWYSSMLLTPKEPVTEENAHIRKCQTVGCEFENKLQNWCLICQIWYIADQPRRPKEAPQCPQCRATWYETHVKEIV